MKPPVCIPIVDRQSEGSSPVPTCEPPIEMNDVTEGHDGAGAQKALCHTSEHGVHETLTACDGPEAPEARDELTEKTGLLRCSRLMLANKRAPA